MLPLLLLFLAVPQDSSPPFVEAVLPDLSTTSGSAEKDYIVEVNGGGLAAADYDGDGALDLVVVDGSTLERVAAGEPGLPPRVFLGDGKGGLAAGGEGWRLPPGRWGTGAASGDWNGDGHTDLLVVEWGRDRLFMNRAGQGFEAVEKSGLAGERWGTSAAFFDAQNDGYLDLVVVNYLAFDTDRVASRTKGFCRWKGHAVMCGPEGLTPVHDQFYANRGGEAFEDVSTSSGFRPERAGFGLGVMCSDVDLDGDTDLYVTNDSTPNHLWENRHGLADTKAWSEHGLRAGVALDAAGKEQAGMGIGCGDLNADGFPDFFVTNFSGESNALYLSVRGGRWRERAAPAGLGGPSLTRLGWGALCADLDLDGDLDLVALNGHVYPQADEPGTDSSYAQADVLHRNVGSDPGRPRFEAEPLSDGRPGVSRAAIPVDLDRDGWLDVIAMDLDGPVRLLHNRGSRIRKAARHWLVVRLRGTPPNTRGLGARVRVEVGEWAAEREVQTAGGFQSAVPAEAHFGLDAAERVERLVVRWPSGRESTLTDVPVDRVLVVEESEAGR